MTMTHLQLNKGMKLGPLAQIKNTSVQNQNNAFGISGSVMVHSNVYMVMMKILICVKNIFPITLLQLNVKKVTGQVILPLPLKQFHVMES